jgi:glycosyltransferase involved in cell wall biosynthesis
MENESVTSLASPDAQHELPMNSPADRAAFAPKRFGMCGFFRSDQFPSGVYSVAENLMRGFAHLRGDSLGCTPFELTVFHGAAGPRWTTPMLTYRQLPELKTRFAREIRVGLYDSAAFDAVLFPDYFTPPIVRARRAVTIIHDLQYLHMPEYWPRMKQIWMRICHEMTLRRCDAVAVISETVRNDILNTYGSRWESRVHAIGNPVSFERLNGPDEQTFSKGRPYLLCAAVDRPPKNLSTLIRAFAKFREQSPEYCLVLAGQLRSDDRSWRRRSNALEAKLPSAVELVKQLGLSEHVVITGYIPDAQLGGLYRGASLFVLPSLYEGFGMPAVESLAMGTPTLVTDLPVLREVTLNSAHYISKPLDDRQLADQIRAVLALGDAARPTAEISKEVRHRFSPETAARQYLKLMIG